MSTTPSGTITASNVRTALNVAKDAIGTTNYPSTTISFNDSLVRVLAGKATGAISMNDMRNKAGPNAYGTAYDAGACGIVASTTFSQTFNNGTYGTYRVDTINSPSCRAILTPITYSTNTAGASITLSSLSGYIAGSSDITITVNSGIYLYATSTGNGGLTINGGRTGDTVTLINNGYIIGMGGAGGNGAQTGVVGTTNPGGTGGPALVLNSGYAITINNKTNAYIAGGGGGGTGYCGGGAGGGGAGGGAGGSCTFWGSGVGGAGGGLGLAGNNGTRVDYSSGSIYSTGGGGGGRVLPGTGGAGGISTYSVAAIPDNAGKGGGAGGGGGAFTYVVGGQSYLYYAGGAGGGANNAGNNGSVLVEKNTGGAGGGGWGASGGGTNPGAGGAAISGSGGVLVYYTAGAAGTFYGTKP
jgi:hypothetical protein